MECLQAKLELDYPDKNGSTLRNTLLSVQRQAAAAGKPFTDERLNKRTSPGWRADRVWSIFWNLNSSRGSNGYGPSPIPFTELLAYSTLYQLRLDTWELDAIRLMDRAYLEYVQRLQNEET